MEVGRRRAALRGGGASRGGEFLLHIFLSSQGPLCEKKNKIYGFFYKMRLMVKTFATSTWQVDPKGQNTVQTSNQCFVSQFCPKSDSHVSRITILVVL
jgi:hypothetical protein